MKAIGIEVKIKFVVMMLLVSTIIVNQMHAATRTWTGAVSSEYGDPSNWSGGVPTVSDDAVIPTSPAGGRFPVITNGNFSAFKFTIQKGAVVTQVGGTISIQDLLIESGTPDGTFNQQNGEIQIRHDFRNSGIFNSTGGRIIFTGSGGGGVTFAGKLSQFYDIIVNSGVNPNFDNVNGSMIMIANDFTNYNTGLDVSNKATFRFNGEDDQYIYTAASTGKATFGNFEIDKLEGVVYLTSDLEVSSNATINDGVLDIGIYVFKRKSYGGALTLNNDSELRIGGAYPLNFSTENLSIGSLINYNGTTNQNVRYGFINGSMKVEGASTKTATGNLTVNGNLYISPEATFNMSGYLLTVNGTLINDGILLSTNSLGAMSFYSRESGDLNSLSSWSNTGYTGSPTTRLPGNVNNDVLIIGNGATINITSNTSNLGTVRVESTGKLILGNYVISGSGEFDLRSGGALSIGSPDGISLSSSNGNVQTAIRRFSSSANYEYNGILPQVTGEGLPEILTDLTINNSSGVTLSRSTRIIGSLNLSEGLLILGDNNLTLGSNTNILGTTSESKMIISSGNGELRKEFSSAGSFTFPIGDNTGTIEYSPITLDFKSGNFSSGYAGVRVVNSKHPHNTSITNYINRYWVVNSSGITDFTCDVICTYTEADIQPGGIESRVYGGKYNGSNWILLDPANVDLNQITGTVKSFSDFTGGENSALPVELLSFKASVKNNSVRLTWQTASEINNYGFELERSYDNVTFSRFCFIRGHGNSNSLNSYSFTDNNLKNGTYYYRLKQIDADGAASYSDVISVFVNYVPSKFELSQNYPNPFNPSTKISWHTPVSSWQTLKVYDILGNEVATLVDEFKDAGFYEIEFNAAHLSSGVYTYKINAGDFSEIKKMILSK